MVTDLLRGATHRAAALLSDPQQVIDGCFELVELPFEDILLELSDLLQSIGIVFHPMLVELHLLPIEVEAVTVLLLRNLQYNIVNVVLDVLADFVELGQSLADIAHLDLADLGKLAALLVQNLQVVGFHVADVA